MLCGYTAGTYTFIIADSHGCIAQSASVDIGNPNLQKLEVTISKTNATCGSNSGSATANPTGGTTPYQGYLWSPGGQTTHTISGLAPGSYTVTVTDANGCTTTATTTILSSGTPPPAPTAINGPTQICSGGCFTYNVTPVPGATSYMWQLPTGATGSSSGPSITICTGTKFKSTGYLCVKAVNACGQSNFYCITLTAVTSKPGTPATITGNFNVCATSNTTETYCIAPLAGATSYVWSIYGNASPSLSIASGQGTLCVTVNIPAGYPGNQYVKVYGVNCKGNGYDKKIKVNRINPPSQPGSISGASSVCKTVASSPFSISSVSGATGYSWSASNGATIASGQGTTAVTVDFTLVTSTPVIISVVASNACGSSIPKTKSVAVNLSCKVSSITPDAESGSDLLQSLTAYPNPSHGKLTLSFNSVRETRYLLRITDVIGNEVRRQDLDVIEGLNTREINLENVAEGLYFITVQTEGSEPQTLRIVIE
jgi:hypothetical protein